MVMKTGFNGADINLKEALLIKEEYVRCVKQVTKDIVLISVDPTDVLLANRLEVIHRFKDSDFGNIQKYQFVPVPQFSLETLPFVVVNGHKTINILNLSKFTMQPLVQAPVELIQSSHISMFFRKET